MRIDAHQHFWRFSRSEYDWIDDSMPQLQRDFLPADLEPELIEAGFDGCIAVQARQTLEETHWLLELAEASPFIKGVVGWADVQAADIAVRLRELAKNPKLVGVRHIVQSEPDDQFLLRPEFLRGIAALEEFGLGYDILIFPKHLRVAAEFVSRFPRQRFVLDHVAKPVIKTQQVQPWSDDLCRLAEYPNVYCKLSGLVTEADWKKWTPEQIFPYLEIALECFGPERLMIGSDWPVCTVAASYSATMNVVRKFMNEYPDAARDAVLGGAAAKFWGLKE